MKKTTINLLVLAALVGSLSVANASVKKGLYLGADVGYSTTSDVKDNKLPFLYKENKEFVNQGLISSYKLKGNDLVYGIRAGYKFNPYLAVEGSLNHFGKVNDKATGFVDEDEEDGIATVEEAKLKANGGTVAVKIIAPITNKLDVYGKLGVAVVKNSIKYYENGNQLTSPDDILFVKDDKTSANLLVGLGAEYTFNDSLSLTSEYQRIHKTKLKTYSTPDNVIDSEDQPAIKLTRSKPSYNTFGIGLNYYFGGKASRVPVPVETLASATLNNDVLFGFNKYDLEPEAQSTLNNLASSINGMSTKQKLVKVSGYSDRIGSPEYNLRLSEKRANSVASYLGNQGVDDITAVGYGQSDPVTGDQCEGVRGRRALIECLAPDRRVEINVQGVRR